MRFSIRWGRVRHATFTFGVIIVVAVATVTWLRVAHILTHATPPRIASPRPDAIVWGDRVFDTRKQLQAWLESRGIDYSVWVRRHPAAVRVVDPTMAQQSAQHRLHVPPTRVRATHETTSRAVVYGRNRSFIARHSSAVIDGALAAALAIAFAALVVAARRGLLPTVGESARLGRRVVARALKLDRLIGGRVLETVLDSPSDAVIFGIAVVSVILLGIFVGSLA